MREVLLRRPNSYSMEREWCRRAERVMPGLPDVARAENEFLARAVAFAAENRGIDRFLVLGDALPFSFPAVDHVVAAGSGQAVYAGDDKVVVAQWRAHDAGRRAVDGVDGSFLVPGTVLFADAVRGSLAPGAPVCLLLTGLFETIPDTDAAATALRACVERLPARSVVVATHASVDGLDPGEPEDMLLERKMREVCRLYEYHHRPPRSLRTAAGFRRVLGDRPELAASVVPAVEWNNPDRAAGSRAESLCLAVVAEVTGTGALGAAGGPGARA
ncbi:S-adenosyl methyltransferase [Amycolatopsis sp. M39]|nr:S-adenosyl methyltransferase [Amycolatopsis sp. M39]